MEPRMVAIAADLVATMAANEGLEVEQQTDRWGDAGQFNCRRFRDVISVLARPG